MNVPLVLTHFLDRAVSLYGDKIGLAKEDRLHIVSSMSASINCLTG